MQENPKSNIVLVNESNHINDSCLSLYKIHIFWRPLLYFFSIISILIFHLEKNENKIYISDNQLFILFQIWIPQINSDKIV